MKKILELLFLKNLKGLGNVNINKKYVPLLESVNMLEECVKLVKDKEENISSTDIDKARENAERKYQDMMYDCNLNVFTIFDDEYPKKLRDLQEKKPVILYARESDNDR